MLFRSNDSAVEARLPARAMRACCARSSACWRSASAKRLFGYIAAGGSAGAIAGPAFNALFVERLGPTPTILVACVLLLLATVLGRRAQFLEAQSEGMGNPRARLALPVGGRAIDDLKRLFSSPYLLAIAGLIICGQVLGGFMYQEQAEYVEAAYATLNERAALFARIDLSVNVLSLLFQTLVVGWVASRGGLRAALGLVPLLLIGSLVLLALIPIGAVLIATQVVRRAVDVDPSGGQFLLTGSASPAPGATAHSGAGRIGRLRMRPMTLSERGVGEPMVSLADLLTGRRPVLAGQCALRLADYAGEILASGFPGLRSASPRALRFQLDSYLRNAVDRDVPEQGLNDA